MNCQMYVARGREERERETTHLAEAQSKSVMNRNLHFTAFPEVTFYSSVFPVQTLSEQKCALEI